MLRASGEKERPLHWTIPNILTASRVVAAPLVAVVFLIFDRPWGDTVAFAIFTAAAITDFLDGWLARRWSQESAVGKMLDPIADKVMIVIAGAVLLALYQMAWWVLTPVVLILMREVLVSGLREFLKGAPILSVTRLAKWKTTAQMAAIAMLFLVAPVGALDTVAAGERPRLSSTGDALAWVAMATLWVAAALTVITGWDYFSKGLAHIRDSERAAEAPDVRKAEKA